MSEAITYAEAVDWHAIAWPCMPTSVAELKRYRDTMNWLDEHAEGRYLKLRISTAHDEVVGEVRFENRDDAAMFRLMWG